MADNVSDFGHDMIHGQGLQSGSATPNLQQVQAANSARQLMNTYDPNSPEYKALQQSMQSNLNPDNGGYLGSVGRALTGQGQGFGENALGLGAMGALALYKQIQQTNALKKSNANMNAWNNQFMQNAKQNINDFNGGNFF